MFFNGCALCRWEVQGAPLVEDELRYSSGPLLVLARARESARYACIASNVAGSARMEASVVVTTPLAARVTPATLTAALGQPATFTCTPSGSPVTHVYWTKDGQVRTSLSRSILPCYRFFRSW